LAVNGLTATTITKCGAVALVANDLKSATVAEAIYDGTRFQLLNPQAVPCSTVASGVLALATNSIASVACQSVTAGSVNSAAAAGVLTTDTITWTPNGSIKAVTGYAPATAGGLTIAPYPSAGYVNFDVCNWTAGAITPGAVTLNWRVVR
jgi:hypothetical protein